MIDAFLECSYACCSAPLVDAIAARSVSWHVPVGCEVHMVAISATFAELLVFGVESIYLVVSFIFDYYSTRELYFIGFDEMRIAQDDNITSPLRLLRSITKLKMLDFCLADICK